MLQRAKDARIDIMMLTVDSITGGNRERDLRTGFSIPFRLTLAGMLQFAMKPKWGINYITHERFRLPQLEEHIDMRGSALSIGGYFTEMKALPAGDRKVVAVVSSSRFSSGF
jgi:L-lactate dehydrogenase (cytochrome)